MKNLECLIIIPGIVWLVGIIILFVFIFVDEKHNPFFGEGDGWDLSSGGFKPLGALVGFWYVFYLLGLFLVITITKLGG